MLIRATFTAAILLFLSALTVNLFSMLQINVSQYVPFVYLLHAGIFAVFIPTMTEVFKNKEITAYKNSPQFAQNGLTGIIKILFRKTPKFFVYTFFFCMLYGTVCFFYFAAKQRGTPDFREGSYVLHHRGKVLQKISIEAYNKETALQLFGFSGIWLAFFSFACAASYPYKS